MSVLTTDLTHTLGSQAPEWTDASTPCRSYDPELWFAERPDEVALAQALCGRLRPARGLPRRCPGAARAVGRLGWRAVRARTRRGAQASPRPSAQGRPPRPARRRGSRSPQRLAELTRELAADDEDLDGDLVDDLEGSSPAQRGGAAA